MDRSELLLELDKRLALASLESLLTSKEGFGLTTATPLQRAICRIIDGRALAELAKVPEVETALGGREAILMLPREQPSEIVLLSGIRSGKSLLAAAAAVRASQVCDVGKLGPGEVPRVSVVSLTKDLAAVVFGHLVGRLQASPALASLLVGEPTSDSLLLRHPTGRLVEVKVVAGSKAGASLVARWSAGVVFDEAPRMVGQEEGVVNLEDARVATLGRMLPGATISYVGSPWAPFGPVYDWYSEKFGKPSRSMVVIKAPAHYLNPLEWTEEKRAKLREQDERAYQTDIEAAFADPETSMFSSVDLDRAERKPPEPTERRWVPGGDYTAAIDPAARSNAFTLIIATKDADGKFIVAAARQWQGSRLLPLSPRSVLSEIAPLLATYRITDLASDMHMGDALRDLAREQGLNLFLTHTTEDERNARYNHLATLLASGMVELPPDPVLRRDLLGVRKVTTQKGYRIELPTTSDGRHCDYAPAVTLALSRWLHAPKPQVRDYPIGSPEWYQAQSTKDRESAIQASMKRAATEWRSGVWRDRMLAETAKSSMSRRGYDNSQSRENRRR